ncbi:MAG: hypothetical protein R3C44_05835 [Chloroflexota bacterium]
MGHSWPRKDLSLIVEVDNHMATADLIQRMLTLQPDGVGIADAVCRLVRVHWPNAQYLQRFVRELSGLIEESRVPSKIVYLGLNGALGMLTADPLAEAGQILGTISGLGKCRRELALWLEDPVCSGR